MFISAPRLSACGWAQNKILLCPAAPGEFQSKEKRRAVKWNSGQMQPKKSSPASHTSTMRPLLMTQMRSAAWMVLNRWAMMSTVRPLVALSRASCTTRSDSASKALVASSRTRIVGFLIKARAMAMRCFWPPDKVTPLSPGYVKAGDEHRKGTQIWPKCHMTAHTNYSVIAAWEGCNEAVCIGLLSRVNDLGVCGLGLPKPNVVHDRWSKQHGFLWRETGIAASGHFQSRVA